MKHKPGELIEGYRPIINKYPYVRSKTLTNAAKGEVCTFGAPGCDRGSETTVWAHANYDFTGKGAGIKSSDVFYFWRAMVRSWNRLIELGIIKVEGAK